MQLKETVDDMISMDYRDRFKAEYLQLKIRYLKIKDLISKFEENKLNFTPDTPIKILKDQLKCMREYLEILELRAKFENISL